MKTLYSFASVLELEHTVSLAEDGDTIIVSKSLGGQIRFVEVASPRYDNEGNLEYMVGTLSIKVGELYIELASGDKVNLVIGDTVFEIEVGYIENNVITVEVEVNQSLTDEFRSSLKVEETFEETPVLIEED